MPTVNGTPGDDLLYGNDFNIRDYIYAEDGDDTLYGGASSSSTNTGDDYLNGGAGNDMLFGQDGNDFLDGGSGNDILYGQAGNDTLYGSTGDDTMRGSTGDDVYYVDDIGDKVYEYYGEGTDLVYSSISYTLTSNVEYLILSGTSSVNATGNSLDNYIRGNSGDNILDGSTGADILLGMEGNDSYYIDNAGDDITEFTGEGIDSAYTSISFTLTDNVERLFLLGSSSINAYGNHLNNYLRGNPGNNILNGYAGADIMYGANGNDTYYVDNSGDSIIENAGEGTDTVYSSISYTLSSNVERLYLTGTASATLTGNSLDNILKGNSANNKLNGSTGADTMYGFAGDDYYYVDNSGDVVTEYSGQGTDTVSSSVSYALTSNVENLTLTGYVSINGLGNTLNNFIKGNSGNNYLNGHDGDDTLSGGSGHDYYIKSYGHDVVYAESDINTLIFTDPVYFEKMVDFDGDGYLDDKKFLFDDGYKSSMTVIDWNNSKWDIVDSVKDMIIQEMVAYNAKDDLTLTTATPEIINYDLTLYQGA